MTYPHPRLKTQQVRPRFGSQRNAVVVPSDKDFHYLVKAAKDGLRIVSFTCQHHSGRVRREEKAPYRPTGDTTCGAKVGVMLDKLFSYTKKAMPVPCPECGKVSYMLTGKTVQGLWTPKTKAERRAGTLKQSFSRARRVQSALKGRFS